jgi:hypothetical protein
MRRTHSSAETSVVRQSLTATVLGMITHFLVYGRDDILFVFQYNAENGNVNFKTEITPTV